jgi:hypothetical protein
MQELGEGRQRTNMIRGGKLKTPRHNLGSSAIGEERNLQKKCYTFSS